MRVGGGTEFQPMLAESLSDPVKQLDWDHDWLASVKLDGYRCVVRGGKALSKNLAPLRNKYLQHVLGRREYNGLDGELIVGPPTPQHGRDSVVGRTSSGVTRADGQPDFTFWCFDDFSAHAHGFRHRVGCVEDRVEELGNPRVCLLPHTPLTSHVMLAKYEAAALAEGFEGVILRAAHGPYKHGRSTAREGYLWKLKRFTDGEILVSRIVEGQHNENEVTEDAVGRTKRSTSKAGMRPNGLVGTIHGKDLKTGADMELSPGRLTAVERAYYMKHPEGIVGHIAQYKAFGYGVKDALRHATFQRLRDPADMSPEGV